MRYHCLILDHDDTVVDSTRQIHYPCFMEYMKKKRPEYSISFEEYMWKNFTPGFLEYFIDELGFTREDLKEEEMFWNMYVQEHTPAAFHGWTELLHQYRNKGGLICVVSHSLSNNIYRDYRENGLPKPDAVYGWDRPEEERKPSPFAIFDIENKYGLSPKEMLMIDDLKPGYDMAKKCGIDFAAAGWAYELPEIRDFMKENSDYYFQTVEELEKVLLS